MSLRLALSNVRSSDELELVLIINTRGQKPYVRPDNSIMLIITRRFITQIHQRIGN